MAKENVESVNDQIHDELISHDIQLRRVDGQAIRDVERRLDRLGADIKAETARIDPFGTNRSDARERRLARLDKRVKELTDEAFRDIAKENRGDMRSVSGIEAEATVQAIEKALP